jgi:hypothetical protein
VGVSEAQFELLVDPDREGVSVGDTVLLVQPEVVPDCVTLPEKDGVSEPLAVAVVEPE